MPSDKQLAANRRNATRSTGPRSPDGKARSSQNAFQHGLTSTAVLFSTEHAAAFGQLRSAFFTEHRPATPTEEYFVTRMVEAIWFMRRCSRAYAGSSDARLAKLLPEFSRQHARHERTFERALKQLTDFRRTPPPVQPRPETKNRENEPNFPTPEIPPSSVVPNAYLAQAGQTLQAPTNPIPAGPLVPIP